jgi:hypothetical protein
MEMNKDQIAAASSPISLALPVGEDSDSSSTKRLGARGEREGKGVG